MTQSIRSQPRTVVSIVTICKNDESGLLQTLESTSKVQSAAIEQVVIDGQSSDGTKEILQSNVFAVSYWVSEPDGGIAEAFNKGIAACSGDYILFLNAGDTILPSMLKDVSCKLVRDRPEIAIGRVLHVDKEGNVIRRVQSRRPWMWQKVRNYWPHQATFIRRDLFISIGGYDESFAFAGMDYEWSLRYMRLRGSDRIAVLDFDIAKMPVGGISMADYKGTFRAYHVARKKNGSIPTILSWTLSEFMMLKRTLAIRIDDTLRMNWKK